MDQAEFGKVLGETTTVATESRLESMLLQTVCAGLMAEVAALLADPR